MRRAEEAGQGVMEEISLFQSLFVYVLAGFLIVGLVMAVGAHVLIRRMIVRPLLEAGEIFRRIAEGDLTRRVADRGRNEIGALLTALKSMQDGLVRTVSSVRRGVDEIHVGAREISGQCRSFQPHRTAGRVAGADRGQHGGTGFHREAERGHRARGQPHGGRIGRSRGVAARRWPAWSRPCAPFPAARRASPISSA